MNPKLEDTIETDGYYYFFTFLSDRFGPLNQRWQQGLEKRFNKPFKPIYVLPFHHNRLFEEENYVVLNEQLAQLQEKEGRFDIINLIYPEDLNKQFSESAFIGTLLQKLIKKQGKVFILPFSSVWLNIDDPNVIILGPDKNVAAKFDDKAEHVRLFERLGINTNSTTIYKDFEELRRNHKEYPFFLSATFSSGGIESQSIYTAEDLEAYYSRLRPINKNHPLIAARLLNNIVLAANTSALVTDNNKTTVVCVSDQILRNNLYMGNIYPSKVTSNHYKLMQEVTEAVGNHLSREGFRGLFGLDFLITEDGQCYPVDLNPRRQGGYFCNAAMATRIDLIDLELRIILGEDLPKFGYKDFQVDYCWAHSKLTPYHHNMRIVKEFQEGDPLEPFTNIGSSYKAIYYPMNHTLLMGNPGFYLATDQSYDRLKHGLEQQTDEIISSSFEHSDS